MPPEQHLWLWRLSEFPTTIGGGCSLKLSVFVRFKELSTAESMRIIAAGNENSARRRLHSKCEPLWFAASACCTDIVFQERFTLL